MRLLSAVVLALGLIAQGASAKPAPTQNNRAAWNAPQTPFRI